MASKAEALAWVHPTEPRVEERIGQVQAEVPSLEDVEVDLHRMVLEVLEVPLGAAHQVFQDPG